jgi:hypothetical protein
MYPINVPWCFTIVLFFALTLNIFVPIFHGEFGSMKCFSLIMVSGLAGGALEAYFVEMGWRKKK